MLAWTSDPIVRFGLRHSVAAVRLMPLVPLALGEVTEPAQGRTLRVGLYLLCCAGPAAAGYLVEMEHNGRLDQIRLAGREPLRIAAAALLTMAGPWLAGAVAFLSVAALGPVHVPNPWLNALAVGTSITVAAVSTKVGFTKERVDPRVGLVALGAVGVATGIASIDAIGFAPRPIHAVLPYVVAFEVAITIWALRGLGRRLAYPRASRGRALNSWWHPSRSLLRWPGFYRGATLSSSGAVLVLIFVPVVLVLRVLGARMSGETAALYGTPLAIGLLAISLICREDATSGRLDIVRQSSRALWRSAAESIAGLWTPFVLITVIQAATVALLFHITLNGVLLTAGLLAIAAPLPVIEGWSRFWPGTFFIPYALALAVMRGIESYAGAALLIALAWWAAVRRFADSDRPVFDGWTAAAIAAAASALPFADGYAEQITFSMAAVPMITVAISPLLIETGPLDARRRWLPTVAIVVAVIGAAALIYPLQQAAAAAAVAALIWEATFQVQRSGLPFSMQAATRMATIVLLSIAFESWLSPWVTRQDTVVAMLLGGATYLALSTCLLHAARFMVSRRQRVDA